MTLARRSFLTAWFARQRVTNAADLAAAARAAGPGDEIVLAAGEWRDADLVVEARGREGAPVRVRAEKPGATVLTGRSRLRMAGAWIVVEGLFFKGCDTPGDIVQFRMGPGKTASDSKLIQCAVVDCHPADEKLNTKWISLYGQRNEVSRCSVSGKRNLGTTLVVWLDGAPNRHRIAENHFGARPPLGMNGGETMRVGDSSTSLQDSLTVVERNWFERCNGEIEAISNKSCGNVYRGNFFDHCEATLTLRHGNRCRVEGNVFFGGGSKTAGGVRVIGEEHVVVNNLMVECNGTGFRGALTVVNGLPETPLNGYARVRRALVAHNTMVDCAQPLAVGINGGNAKLTEAPEDVRVLANLVGSGPDFVRDASGIPRPRRARVAGDFVAEVVTDIDGQRRGRVRVEGCDEAGGGLRLPGRGSAGVGWG